MEREGKSRREKNKMEAISTWSKEKEGGGKEGEGDRDLAEIDHECERGGWGGVG